MTPHSRDSSSTAQTTAGEAEIFEANASRRLTGDLSTAVEMSVMQHATRTTRYDHMELLLKTFHILFYFLLCLILYIII